jgi:hypothetical protein
MSVTVPANEGRKIAAWLAPQSEAAAIREGVALFDLEQRLMRRSPMWTKLYTHEDLRRLNIRDATDAVQRFRGQRPDSWDCAYVDGDKTKHLPLWAIAADEIELLEADGAKPARSGRTSIMNNPTLATSKDPFKCDHWVWLRK